MSSTIDRGVLELLVERATPDQKRFLLDRLLTSVVRQDGTKPRVLDGGNGRSLGVFFPDACFHEKPPMSESRYAELVETVRNTTDDQLVSFEEMMRRLGLEGVRLPSRA